MQVISAESAGFSNDNLMHQIARYTMRPIYRSFQTPLHVRMIIVYQIKSCNKPLVYHEG